MHRRATVAPPWGLQFFTQAKHYVAAPIREIESKLTLHDFRQYQDLHRIRGRSAFSLLFLFSDSIYSIVLKPLALLITVDLLLLYLMTYVPAVRDNTYFNSFLTFAAEQLIVFPGSLVLFSLGFLQSQILGEWRKSFGLIEFGDKIAVRCLDIGDQSLRKLVMQRVHQMTAISFSYLSDSFSRKMREGEFRDAFGESVMSNDDLDFVLEENSQTPPYWLPVKMLKMELQNRKDEGLIDDTSKIDTVVEAHQESCRELLKYKWFHLPLAYVQVVSMMVYLYMTLSVLARHAPNVDSVDAGTHNEALTQNASVCGFVVLVIKCFVFVGWLNVAVKMAFPFGGTNLLLTPNVSVCGFVVLVIKCFVFVGWLNVAVKMAFPFGEGQEQFDLSIIFRRMLYVHASIIAPMSFENQPRGQGQAQAQPQGQQRNVGLMFVPQQQQGAGAGAVAAAAAQSWGS